jgi:hypothetical protein
MHIRNLASQDLSFPLVDVSEGIHIKCRLLFELAFHVKKVRRMRQSYIKDINQNDPK